MKNWITFPKSEGLSSKQAHADLPPNTYEREQGKEGFFGPSSHLHHLHAPTAWKSFEGPLRPRAFDLVKMAPQTTNPWDAMPFMSNAHTRISWWHLDKDMLHLARNGDGDMVLFIHAGAGDFYCDYGHMEVQDGDYILIPRGTMWRFEVAEPFKMLMIEAVNDSLRLPDKGIVGPHALFDAATLASPMLDEKYRAQQETHNHDWQVLIKRRNQLSTVAFGFNPLDVIGWHGTLVPVKVNWRDIRPLMSHRYHLPPSAHTTFVANRFVICTFCPRPIESDPGALKVPFYHNNDDFDEFIFYHKGEFFSRDNIHPGMVTLHPCGFTHGPHPKAFAAGAKAARKETDEVAVMIDTRDALDVADIARDCEWNDYVHSWKGIEKP